MMVVSRKTIYVPELQAEPVAFLVKHHFIKALTHYDCLDLGI
jgi:hypothetical protein